MFHSLARVRYYAVFPALRQAFERSSMKNFRGPDHRESLLAKGQNQFRQLYYHTRRPGFKPFPIRGIPYGMAPENFKCLSSKIAVLQCQASEIGAAIRISRGLPRTDSGIRFSSPTSSRQSPMGAMAAPVAFSSCLAADWRRSSPASIQICRMTLSTSHPGPPCITHHRKIGTLASPDSRDPTQS
jgi:hypothetical protein